jgi:hypothetical protein
MALETVIRDSMTPKDAGVIAVEHLVSVKKPESRKEDFGTEIELKTELSEMDVFVHTVCDEVNRWLSLSKEDDMANINVLGTIVERKERKLLSKGRKSRSEIVEVARPQQQGDNAQTQNFIRRLFTPRP